MKPLGSLRPLLLLAAAGSLTACSGELNDARHNTGGTSVVASSDYQALYVANADQGTISIVDRDSATVTEIDAGLEPVRLARADGRVFATLRGERAVGVFREVDGGLEFESRIPVGAEPFGIVADEKGKHLYVANQLGGEVMQIDAQTLEITKSWAVEGQPRWVALHPSGKHLYVGSAYGGILTDIHVGNDKIEQLELPPVTGLDPQTFEPVELSARVTGDLAVSPDGTSLSVPSLYINNVSEVGEVDPESLEPPDDGGYAGGGPDGTRRFNPAVVLVVTNHDGKLRTEYTDTLTLQGFGRNDVISSYPSSATYAPDGEHVVLTLEGSDAAMVVQVPESIGNSRANMSRFGGMDTSVEFGSSMQFATLSTVLTGSAPRAVTFVGDREAWVHNGFEGSVADLRFGRLEDNLGGDCCFEDVGFVDGDEEFGSSDTTTREAIPITTDILPPEVSEGRKMFFSASNEQMALPGAAVSCSTCHFDGRNDGLTWQFSDGPRQTPSLAGEVSLTAPVTWVNGVETVTDEVIITSQGRMGGSGLALSQAEKVAAYVDWSPLPDTPLRGSASDAVERGRAIFESEEVGCADCHNGVALTDNENYDMFGLEQVRTRGLLGIAASAPYLHDGSAPTLRSVLEAVRLGEMGDTGSLTTDQMDDLEAYMLSL